MDENLMTVTLHKRVLELIEERGVKLEDVAEIVYDMQVVYNPKITLEICLDAIKYILNKREILHAFVVGIELDMLAEKGLLSEPLQTIIESDESLFGVDETLAIGGCYGYGSIALTTFGFLDKQKTGIIKDLDSKEPGKVHTFLDDLICMLAANASARVAHKNRDEVEKSFIGFKEENS